MSLLTNSSPNQRAMFRSWVQAFFTFLLVFIICSNTSVFASTPIVVDDNFTERAIGLDIDIYEDKTTKLTLNDIRSAELSAQFKPSTQNNPSFGFTHSPYWVRFEIDDLRNPLTYQALLPLYLTLAFAPTDNLDFWCANKMGTLVVQQRAGDHVPLSEWPNTFREPVFEISPLARTCWLRVTTNGDALQIPLKLSNQQSFVNMRLKDTTFQALYFGALLVMVIYNGLLAVTTRSWAYGSYTFFLMSFGLFQTAINGIGYRYLWTGAIGWADTATLIFMATGGISGSLFAINLLDLPKSAPRFFKFGKLLIVLFAFQGVVSWFLPFALGIQFAILIVTFGLFYLLFSAVYLSFKKVRIAQIYMAAWLMFITGCLINNSMAAGLLPINAFTANAMQIGSVFEFILLSFALADRIKITQANLLDAQKKIAEGLRLSEQELSQKVEQRTAELKNANQIAEQERDLAMTAKAQAELEQQKAETARKQTAQALDELKATQTQLIAAEKMASLGLLVSNVAHEINTPIGAVKSSGTLISDTLDSALPDLSKLFAMLDDTHRALFVQLITQCKQSTAKISTREERALTKQLTAQLQDVGVEDASRNARLLMKLRAHQNPLEYLPLLQHPDNEFILDTAGNMANIINGTSNINSAVEKVSRVVYALKALSGDDVVKAAIVAPLLTDMDKALAKYQNQMHSVELVTNFQSDMPPIHADHDAMEQLCIHLVMNALQAMNYEGKLTVGLNAENNQAIISVADTGSGIADDIKGRIFEPFFTTRTSGEGSGMGLAIVKRIVEQHQGQIDVQTEVGVGTTLTVKLPYQ